MITVVVLTYNNLSTIDACLSSLGRQSVPPAEIIVVDDESTDGTLEAIGALRNQIAVPFKIVSNGRHNIAHGRNLGLDSAASKYVAFIDSDAVADSRWIEGILKAFVDNPKAAIVGGEIVGTHSSTFAEAVVINDEVIRQLFTHDKMLIDTCNLAVRTDLLAGRRFNPDWKYAEDVEFVQRVTKTDDWAFAPNASVQHYARVEARSYMRQMYQYGKWRVRFSTATKVVRPVDYVPSSVLILSIVLAARSSRRCLFAFPLMCVSEAIFVCVRRQVRPQLWPVILYAWAVKNSGWSAGIISGSLHLLGSGAARRKYGGYLD